jgi:ankyrin repeat protein
MQLLKDTSQGGTTWSVVYLPKSAEILFSVYQDWDRIYRLGFPENPRDGSPRAARGPAQAPASDSASKGAGALPSSGSKSGQTLQHSSVLVDELLRAVEEGDTKAIRKLARAHPGLPDLRDATGSTALLSAVQSGKAPVVALLLELGADPSACNRFGFSPLHRAVENDRPDVVELLLARKADVDAVVLEGYYGYTPMTFAIMKGSLQVVRTLHAAGADLRHRTNLEENYLHFAAAFNRTDIAEYLIARGLDVNAPKAGGLTPLHIAAVTGGREMVELLIRKGAGLDTLSADRGTPLHFAAAAKNSDIADLLRRGGAADRPRAFPEYKGRYLGQTPPGPAPRPFAPELFRDIYRAYGPPVFSPDGKEMFFYAYFMPWVGYSRIWRMREQDGRWSAPELAPFSDHPSWQPAFSPDGNRLYFASRRSRDGTTPEATDIWFAEKKNGEWGRAQFLGSPPNRDDHNEMLPTAADDGSLYFMAFGPSARGTRIFRSRFADGRFTSPIPLDDLIDQGLADEIRGVGELIVYRYAGSRYAEISICFRHPDGRWTRPVSLGDLVHRGHGTNAGAISPDRRYFFFCQDIAPYWVDASFIEGLRREALPADPRS